MQRLLLLAVIFGLLTTPFWVGSNSAEACYCAPPDVKIRVAESDLIFVGVLRDVSTFEPIFEVTRVLKGSAESVLRVNPGEVGSTCSFMDTSPAIGHEFLIFATERSPHPRSDICAGNVDLTANPFDQDYAALLEIVDQDQTPQQGDSSQDQAEEDEKDPPWAVILPLAFGIPLATLLVPAFFRRGGAGH
jgi:hypothetical protein